MRLVLNLAPTTAHTSGFLLWGLLFFHRGCPSEGPVLELHFSSHSECKGISLNCRLSADDSQISNSSLNPFPRFQAQPSNCLLHISPWMSLRCLELNVLITDFFFTPLSKSHFQVLFSSCHVYLQWKSPPTAPARSETWVTFWSPASASPCFQAVTRLHFFYLCDAHVPVHFSPSCWLISNWRPL